MPHAVRPALISLLLAVAAVPLSAKEGEATRLAAIVSDEDASLDEKWGAAEKLEKLSPHEAIPAVFERLRPLSLVNVWKYDNSWCASRRETLVRAPGGVQSSFLLHRVWSRLTAAAGNERGDLVAPLLAKATNDVQRDRVLVTLFWDWSPRAETAAARILRDGEASRHVRERAARALLENAGATYYEEIRDLAARFWLPVEFRFRLVQMLLGAPRPGAGPDGKLLVVGFKVMEDTIWHGGKDAYGSGIAQDLGRYLGRIRDFSPDRSLEKYGGENGPNEAFGTDTVRNARRWWRENRWRYERR